VQGDREVATKISEELGGLPLALDQAGAYIEETQCSLPDYQSLYRTRRAEVLKERGGIMGDHPDSVATTWSLSFQRVQERNAAAADLLRFCAFLHPDAIPEEIITAGAEHLGPLLQTIAHDTMALNKAIAALGGHSLIRRDPAEKILSVHRLVQAVLRDAMADDEAKVWAERAVRAMNAVFPDADPDADFVPWRVYERYLLHVLVCTDLVKQKQFTFLEAASLFYQTGKYLIGRAQYQEAEPLLLHALDIYKYLQGPNTATCLNGLAVLYKNQSKYELAEVRYQQVLEIYEQQLGPEHPSTAGCLNNLAVLCRTQGKYEQAELLSQRALAICEKALGPEHPHTARNLNNLAKLYCKQGKYDQAESLFQRALAIRKKWLGPEHPSTATSLDNLGRLYNAQGKYDQAEPLHQRALEIREQQLGLLHPDTAQSLNNLALLYQVQGKYEQAGPLCQRALAIYEKALGSQHPSTQQARQNYTALLRVIGRDEEAKQLEDTPTHDIPDTYLSSVVADETCLPDEQY
jgi:tetratricopeptide (TPR) repeat protein